MTKDQTITLTDAERETLHEAIHLPIYNPIHEAIVATVERILAARVAAARADERARVLGEVEKDVPLATRLADPGDYVREQLIEGDFGDPWDMPLWQREHLARVIEAFTSVTPSAPTHADEEDRAAMSIDPEPPGATLRPFTPAEAEALDLREQAGDER